MGVILMDENGGGSSSSSEERSRMVGPQHYYNGSTTEDKECCCYYYRVIYKGVIALVSDPEEESKEKSGAYISYGEIITSSSPPSSSSSNNIQEKICVENVLTGGYALDMVHNNNNSHGHGHFGYVPCRSLVEEIAGPPLLLERNGPYYYQMKLTGRILSGPALDAPLMKGVLLQHSIVEISTKLQWTLDGVVFLRLAYKKGWMVDRIILGGGKQKQNKYTSTCQPLHHWTPPTNIVDDGASFTTSTTCNSTDITTSSIVSNYYHRKKRPIRRNKQQQPSLKTTTTTTTTTTLPSPMSSPILNQPPHPNNNHSPYHHNNNNNNNNNKEEREAPQVLLMRVTATKGLKLLDAPQFQVTQFLRPNHHHNSLPSPTKSDHSSSSSKIPSIFPSTSVITHHSVEKPKTSRTLPRNTFFEASKRMETSSMYPSGVIKLADNTGWAIVSSPNVYEEVGAAYKGSTWVRILPPNGLMISCRGVGVSSSRSSFTTTTKNAAMPFRNHHPPPHPPVLPCGICVQVDKYTPDCQFVRLHGGAGWIPQLLNNNSKVKTFRKITTPPQIQFGSYWFRVTCPKGIHVRQGPSMEAPPILYTSKKDSSTKKTYVRFECGEYLRASEIYTIGPHSFCKLYRRTPQQQPPSQKQTSHHHHKTNIEDYLVPWDWVPICSSSEEVWLESVANPPRIQRKAHGWKVLLKKETPVRMGPCTSLPPIHVLKPTDVEIHEVVSTQEEQWFRLKDGSGWILHNQPFEEEEPPPESTVTTQSYYSTLLLSRFFDSKK